MIRGKNNEVIKWFYINLLERTFKKNVVRRIWSEGSILKGISTYNGYLMPKPSLKKNFSDTI